VGNVTTYVGRTRTRGSHRISSETSRRSVSIVRPIGGPCPDPWATQRSAGVLHHAAPTGGLTERHSISVRQPVHYYLRMKGVRLTTSHRAAHKTTRLLSAARVLAGKVNQLFQSRSLRSW
jgi:hypothetical protein